MAKPTYANIAAGRMFADEWKIPPAPPPAPLVRLRGAVIGRVTPRGAPAITTSAPARPSGRLPRPPPAKPSNARVNRIAEAAAIAAAAAAAAVAAEEAGESPDRADELYEAALTAAAKTVAAEWDGAAAPRPATTGGEWHGMALSEPFPETWYTNAFELITTRQALAPVREPAPAPTWEPPWHSHLIAAIMKFDIVASDVTQASLLGENGHRDLAAARDELSRLSPNDLRDARDALVAHQNNNRCAYCQSAR